MTENLTVATGQSSGNAAGAAHRRRRFPVGYLLVAPPFLIMLLLIIYPALLAVFDTVVVNQDGITQFTLARYSEFFQTPLAVQNLLFTLRITVITVALLFVLCFPIALYLRFRSGRVSNVVQTLSLFPMFVPGIVTAYALIRFLGANGWFDRMLAVFFGFEQYTSPYLRPAGIVIGLFWEGIPITILILTAGLSQIGDELLETARDVGANRWQLFWRVIFPLMRRSVLIVLTLNFLGIFGAFTIPYLLGPASPEMMGVYMRRTFYDANLPSRAQVQAVITFLISALVSVVYVRSIVSQRLAEGEG